LWFPALRGEQFCYFHQRMLRTVNGPPDSRLHHVALLENAEAIQASLMELVDALVRKTIDLPRAELVLRTLNTAVRNARRVHFDIHADDMVTRVPNYPDPPEPEPAPVANSVHVATAHVGTDALGCPSGPEVSGRSEVTLTPGPALSANAPGIKPIPNAQTSREGRQPKLETDAPNPTRPKPPASVKNTEAPKERKIAAHRASGG
jgi:hypothetical protein